MTFDRKRPVHLPNINRHNQPAIVYLTVCTKDRLPILANESMHRVLIAAWKAATTWHVGQYMIMPEHVHVFCSPAVLDVPNVRVWTSFWKGIVSRGVKGHGPVAEIWTGSGGTSPSRENVPDNMWQTDCWDMQLRNVSHYAEKWDYVRANPVRKGWVAVSEDWPYQGCLNELRW